MLEEIWRILNYDGEYVLFLGILFVVIVNHYYWRYDRLARLQPQSSLPLLDTCPAVSVLVAAWNDTDFIEKHIQSFLALSYPSKQLILCAGGYDRTFDIASQYHDGKAIIVIEQVAGEGKQAALRKCLPRATGEIIYLTDSDCLLNDDAFIRLIAPIVKGEYEAVNGTSHPLKTQQNNAFVMYQWTVDHYAHARAPEHSSGLLGRNCAVSAQPLRQTGGFDEEAKSGTDYTLARQLIDNGYTIYNEKYSSVETEYPSSLRSYYYKRTRWLRNTIVLGYKKKDYGSMLPSLFTSCVGVFMLILPLGGLIFAPFFMLWVWLIVHAILSRLRYVFFCREQLNNVAIFKVFLMGILILPIDFYISATTLLQVVFPRWRTIWK